MQRMRGATEPDCSHLRTFIISMVQLNFQGILSAFFTFDLPAESRPLTVTPASLGVP